MKSNPPSNEALASLVDGLFGVVYALTVSHSEISTMILETSNIPDSPARQQVIDTLAKMLEDAKAAMASFNEARGCPTGIRSGMY